MSTPVSQHHLPDSPDAPSAPPPPSSPFLLPLRTLAAAAASNPNLKLKSLLTKPELAAAVRAEFVPNGMKLVDLYDIVLWMSTDATWKALGYTGVCKHNTLYTWVRLLAPESCLSEPEDFILNELKAWYLRVKRAAEQFRKDIEKYSKKRQKARSVAARSDNTTNLNMVVFSGNRLLNFNGFHNHLGFKASTNSDSPLPTKSLASLTSPETTPPTRSPLARVAPLTHSPPAADVSSTKDAENSSPQANISRRDLEAAKVKAEQLERKARAAEATAHMLSEERHECDMTKLKALVDLGATKKVAPPCPPKPQPPHSPLPSLPPAGGGGGAR